MFKNKSELREIDEIEIASPIEGYNIDDDYLYKGTHGNVYPKGVSKIKRFYYEKFFTKKGSKNPVWMELENGTIILIGLFDYKNRFIVSNNFND